MFEEIKKSYASFKKAKEEATKRHEELRTQLEEFKTTVSEIWKSEGLSTQKFKLNGGELAIDGNNHTVTLSSSGTLSKKLLQEAADAVSNYLYAQEAKYQSSWNN